MDFLDIQAYPKGRFKEYWNKIYTDPYFFQIVSTLNKQYSWLSERASQLATWEQYRKVLYRLVSYLIKKTTGGLSWSGTENIPEMKKGKSGAIFVSSHRSTSLDPILFNYMLFEETGNTGYTAFGDNLLSTPWLGHLIRLTGGFIVKRKVQDVEQKLAEAEKLAMYIRKLLDSGKHVWIAQRNGRAKDGNDRTDSAVLTMLKLAHRDKNWEEFSTQIPIIPVSMSYEEVPLDTTIVREEQLGQSDGHLDSAQVLTEINQEKRRIHVHVSERIRAGKRAEIVSQLDENIINGLKIWDSNRDAYDLLTGKVADSSGLVQWFKEKLASQEPRMREALLKFYAAPLINQIKLK